MPQGCREKTGSHWAPGPLPPERSRAREGVVDERADDLHAGILVVVVVLGLDDPALRAVVDPGREEGLERLEAARALPALCPRPLQRLVPVLLAHRRAGVAADERDDRDAVAVVDRAVPRDVVAVLRVRLDLVDEVGL